MPAAGSHHHILRRGRGHLHHEPDDVARRAELAVLPGGGQLAQHVLVDVALGIAVVHGDVVDQVDDLGEQRRRGDGEAGVAHVVRVGGCRRPSCAGTGRCGRQAGVHLVRRRRS